MRVWLQKQKKKEEAKAAAQAATPVPESTSSIAEVSGGVEGADKPVDSVEEATATDNAAAGLVATAAGAEDGQLRTVSASTQPQEVGFQLSSIITQRCLRNMYEVEEKVDVEPQWLNSMNTIKLARAGGCSMHFPLCAITDVEQGSAAPENDDLERRGSLVSQTATQSAEPSATANNASSDEQNKATDAANATGNNPMMNGMQGQMGFGFQGQGNFGTMGFNGMSNMVGNANWNGMNQMGTLILLAPLCISRANTSLEDLNMNNMNGMYNNFGGNMGMAMNDMSAMNMMNYGGGYGNGWNGMGGGYGNFNGFNQMGGYNQSGAYPEMMNQFPKNNFQNQNRFPASQGALSQQNNTAGSQGGSVSGPGGQQNASSRPGSRSGPAQNVRSSHKFSPGRSSSALKIRKPATDDMINQQPDGESPNASADAADSKPDGEQDAALKPIKEGNDESSAQNTAQGANPTADGAEDAGGSTVAGRQDDHFAQTDGLNQIQTIDSEDGGMQGYNQSMLGNGMNPNVGFANGMMNQFSNQMQMNAPFDPSMNMGFHQNNNFGPRGGFNAAYGAATVLTGEPQGRGVEGAPTGPRAMREGRPNTGFSSRMSNARYQPPPKSVTPAQSVGARSPQRRPRS